MAATRVPSSAAQWSGHSLATVDTILERYMVRTSKMARAAFGQRAEAEGKGTLAVAAGAGTATEGG